MTKREALRQVEQKRALRDLGFTVTEADQLRRISMTLHRWHELECGDGNGCIERDEATGKAYWLNSHTMRRTPIADRETGARKRLEDIIRTRNGRDRAIGGPDCTRQGEVSAYIQTDPRGAALYIIRPGDVPQGASVESYYNRGIVVY
jgi:hypothetical protein